MTRPHIKRSKKIRAFYKGCLVILFCGMLLLGFSWLREDQIFWRDIGGYPPLLRAVVTLAYYPLLLFCGIGVLLLTLALLRRSAKPLSRITLEIILLSCCWALVLGSLLIAFGDDLENIWHGKVLHHEGAGGKLE